MFLVIFMVLIGLSLLRLVHSMITISNKELYANNDLTYIYFNYDKYKNKLIKFRVEEQKRNLF